MAKYVTINVKIVREFDEHERTEWGAKYLGVLGEAGNERYVLFNDEDIVEEDVK
jgi:hypothetical protein